MKQLVTLPIAGFILSTSLLFADPNINVGRPPLVVTGNNFIWGQPPVLPPHPVQDTIESFWTLPVLLALAYESPREEPYVSLKPYGYVKWEAFFDSRQVIGLRQESEFLFPAPRFNDIYGRDINAHGLWNMTAFETRCGAILIGPDWGSCQTDAVIEGDFRGSFQTGIFNFRLRAAFGRITWDTGTFLFGQWWHPLWIPECFPHTLGYGIGAPLDPQARNPQLRITQRWNCFEFIGALLSQADFFSNGPIGPSPVYMEDAVVPNFHAQMRAYIHEWAVIGIAADYKRLAPRIVTDNCVKAKEHNNSFIVEGFAACVYEPWFVRMKAYWAQNGADQLLISGYGVRTIDRITDCRTYANTACAGGWLDFSYIFHCAHMELGLFVGGTKNLGSRECLYIEHKTGLPIIYGLLGKSQDIDYVVQVTPRYVYIHDPLRAGIEFQVSRASWGTPDEFGKVKNGCPVTDFRVLLVLYYMF